MNRAGTYVENLTGEATYQFFKSNPLPPMPEINRDEETLPVCCRLIKEIQEVLMKNVRGQDKTPGEFRHSQN